MDCDVNARILVVLHIHRMWAMVASQHGFQHDKSITNHNALHGISETVMID